MKKWGFTPYIIIFLSMLTVIFGFSFWQKTKGIQFGQQLVETLGWEKKDVTNLALTKVEETPTPTPMSLSKEEGLGQVLALPVILGGSVDSGNSNGLDSSTNSTSLVDRSDLVNPGSLASDQFWRTLEVVRPGFVVVFGEGITLEQMQFFSQELRGKTKTWQIQPMLAVDHEGGKVQRLSGVGFTKVPSWREVCQLEDNERFDLLEKVATELESAGINIVFGPVVDLFNQNSSIGDRACDSDPGQVALHALDTINIFSRHQILSVIKHYPGLGQSKIDTHFKFEVVNLSLDDIEPFRQILTQKPSVGVMTAHVGIKDLYDEPCTLSKACISSLRNAHGGAVIFSDALDMKAVFGGETSLDDGDLVGVSEKALEADLDVLVLGKSVDLNQVEKLHQVLLEKYTSDSEFARLVNDSLGRLIEYHGMLKSMRGLLDIKEIIEY